MERHQESPVPPTGIWLETRTSPAPLRENVLVEEVLIYFVLAKASCGVEMASADLVLLEDLRRDPALAKAKVSWEEGQEHRGPAPAKTMR